MKLIKGIFRLFRDGISRFFVTFLLSCAAFVVTLIEIYAPNYDIIIISKIVPALMLSIILSVLVQLTAERYKINRKPGLAIKILSALTAVPAVIVLHFTGFPDNEYAALGYGGILLICLIACIYILFSDENRTTLLSHIVKTLTFSGFISLVFLGGILLCVAAFYFLIYTFTPISEIIFTVVSFAFFILFINLFLSQMPKDNEKNEIPKAFKYIVLYAAFPIYLLLLLILYIYLGKILITFDMPGGQINIFASLAMLFYVFFYLTVPQYEEYSVGNKIISYWKKFGGYLMFPIIIAQGVAVYIRVSAYGLTEARWASILMSCMGIVFIVLSLIKDGKYVKYAFAALALTALVSTVTPLNIFDFPVYRQTARLESILTRNGMLDGGVVSPGENISDGDKQDIVNIYSYLYRKEKAPDYIKGNFENSVGFDFYSISINPEYNTMKYYNGSSQLPKSIDISEYNRQENFSQHYRKEGQTERIILAVNGDEYDITDKIFALAKDRENEKYTSSEEISIQIGDNIKVYILLYNLEKDTVTGKFTSYYLEGFALIK